MAEETAASRTPPPAATAERYRLVDRSDARVSVLNNGLTVLLVAHRAAPVVSVRMYCRTGSIYEQEYLGTGISHLFEHLLHGGATTTRSEEESRRILQSIGDNTNAYTSLDRTAYFINTDREHLGTAVGLVSDWLTRPTWPQEAFDREWSVVQRELERDTDSPDRQLFYLMMETMYRHHPARYPVIGHQPVVQTVTREDILTYYDRMYVPDNIVVCISGDIDFDEALATVQHALADFPRRPVPTVNLPDEPEMATPRFASKRMKIDTALMALVWPTISLEEPDLYALDVLSYILSEGESARLIRTIRDAGLVYTVRSFSWTPHWGRGVLAVSTRLAPEKIDAAREAILAQMAELVAESVSEEELAQAKRQKAAQHVFGLQTAEQVGEQAALDYLSTGDIDFSRTYVENINKVTAEQVRQAAARYLSDERMATITILPETAPAVSAPVVAEAVESVVRKVTLSNGLRCLIQPDPSSPLVAIQLFSLGGVLYETPDTHGMSQLVAALATRGTETRTAEQIARFFDSRGGTFRGSSGNNTIYYSAQVLKEDFAEAMEVVADVATAPTFPEEELDRYRPRLLDRIRQIDEVWRSELQAYLQRRMFTHSPYRLHVAGSAEVVAETTRSMLEAFHRERVTGAGSVLAIYGDVDPAEAEVLAERYFSGLPAGQWSLPEVPAEVPIDEPVVYVKPKPSTRTTAGVALGYPGLRVTDVEDMAAVAVLNTVMSGYRYPSGWLHESLRGGDTGLVYEVHAINRAGLLPGHFEIYAACQPEMVNTVYGIMKAQVQRARDGQFTEEELRRAQAIIRTTERMRRQTNADRAMWAALDELYGIGYDDYERFLQRVDAVTLSDLQRMADRYLTSPVIAIVTPAPDVVDIGVSLVHLDDSTWTEPTLGHE